VKILIRDELDLTAGSEKVKLWRSPEATPDVCGYSGPCEEREVALLKAFNHLGSVPTSEELNSFSQSRHLTVDFSLFRLFP